MKEGGITRRAVIIILLIIVLIAIILVSYYIYTSSKKCDNETCFTSSLANCIKATYTRDDGSEIIKYNILGSDNFQCSVNVQVQQIKTGSAELSAIEGKDMTCLIPLGSVEDPARNLKNCHGLLKEEIQDIMIQRLHSQIIQNLGKIAINTSVI